MVSLVTANLVKNGLSMLSALWHYILKKKNYNKNHDEVQSVHSKGELINLCLFSDSSALTAGHSLAILPMLNASCRRYS